MHDNPTLLPRPQLNWQGDIPFAADYGDIYYKNAEALDESFYTFVAGCDLPARFATADAGRPLCIGETGFGTGLNFLATWQAWREAGRTASFTFISSEAHPMRLADLAAAHAPFSQVHDIAEQLRSQWPPPVRGIHPLSFEGGRVRLYLLFGDSRAMFSQLACPPGSGIDAWFLDGFAPAKNADMWSGPLFKEIARLSRPGARLATFTAAGFVRRGLNEHGFAVQKAPGFGKKRERILARFEGETHATSPGAPWNISAQVPTGGRVAVIGGGIMGLLASHAIQAHGRQVQLFAPPHIPSASRVPAAILAPGLKLDRTQLADFASAAFIHACTTPLYDGARMEPGGVLTPSCKKHDEDRLARLAEHYAWGDEWVSLRKEGLWLARAACVDTAAVFENLTPTLDILPYAVRKLSQRPDGRWQVSYGDGAVQDFETVVLAAGPNNQDFLEEDIFPRRYSSGHTLWIEDDAQLPRTSAAFDGYLSPPIGSQRLLGSSFLKSAEIPDTPQTPCDAEIKAISHATDEACHVTPRIRKQKHWYGVRATSYDHLPLLGPVAKRQAFQHWAAPMAQDAKNIPAGPAPLFKGLYMAGNLGSKGYQYAPLLAEILAAHISGTPLPLATDNLARLAPSRALIRALVRGEIG